MSDNIRVGDYSADNASTVQLRPAVWASTATVTWWMDDNPDAWRRPRNWLRRLFAPPRPARLRPRRDAVIRIKP